MPAPRHRFVQRFRVDGARLVAREERTLDGQYVGPTQQFPVRSGVRARGMRAIKLVLSRLLRWSGRGLFVSPVLWLVHLVIRDIRGLGGVAILVFVGLVVVFFALLNLFIFASAIVWLADKKLKIDVPFDAPEDETLPLEAHRFVGTLRAVERSIRGDVLWQDAWDDQGRRVAEGVDLVLEREDALPLVLESGTAPMLLGEGETRAASELSVDARKALGLGPKEKVRVLTLRAGDAVEVFTTRAPEGVVLEQLELHGKPRTFHRKDDSAYRGGVARAEKVGTGLGTPIVIRRH